MLPLSSEYGTYATVKADSGRGFWDRILKQFELVRSWLRWAQRWGPGPARPGRARLGMTFEPLLSSTVLSGRCLLKNIIGTQWL